MFNLNNEKSKENLKQFKELISNVLKDKSAFDEKILRDKVSAMAENCPIDLLISLAHNIVEYREVEIKEQE